MNEAPLATTQAQQAGLQALIWSVVTPNFKLDPTWDSNNSSALVSAYNSYKAALTTEIASGLPALGSSVIFITPSTNGLNSNNQALVGYTPGNIVVQSVVPEPSTIVGASMAGLMGLIYGLRQRRKRTA